MTHNHLSPNLKERVMTEQDVRAILERGEERDRLESAVVRAVNNYKQMTNPQSEWVRK